MMWRVVVMGFGVDVVSSWTLPLRQLEAPALPRRLSQPVGCVGADRMRDTVAKTNIASWVL